MKIKPMLCITILAAVFTGISVNAQKPDYKRLIQQDRYRDIIKFSEKERGKNTKAALVYFARAVALDSIYAFEEAEENFKKAKAAGISESETLGNAPFSEWASYNAARIKYIPQVYSYPPGKKKYQISIRATEDHKAVSVARKVFPSIIKNAQKFFGYAPDRMTIFILNDEETLEAHWNETKFSVSKDMRGRGAYASGVNIFYFAGKMGERDERAIEETFAHEFAHTMHALRHPSFHIDDRKNPTWFTEGLATFFASQHLKESKEHELKAWKSEYDRISSIPWNGFKLDFQENVRSRLHYRTASLMIRNFIETYGQKKLNQMINETATKDDANADIPAYLQKFTGMNEEEFFNENIGLIRQATGAEESGPQVKTDTRDYIPGDAILVKDKGRSTYEPAMMLRKTGDSAYVRFFWGGQSTLSYAKNTIKFDWKRGMQVRCRGENSDEKQLVTIEALTEKNLKVKFPAGSSETLAYDRCEDIR